MKRVGHDIDVLHRDSDVLVLNKPAGLLSIPGRDRDEASLLDMVEKEFGKVFVVHRLDRHTSGVIVFALNAEAHRSISIQFEEGRVSKTYRALVRGEFHEDEGVINAPLAIRGNGLVGVAPNGKASTTTYRVIERFRGFTYLELVPETGRLHQIRVHLMHIGKPLVVDAQYGLEKTINIGDIKRSAKGQNLTPLLKRTPLHAYSIRLGDDMEGEYHAPLPKDMRTCLKQLRKWRKPG